MSSGILHSNEAFKYGSLLGEECFKLTGDQDLSIRSPIDREYVVRKFDDGFFHELLMRYETEKGEQLWPLADKFAVFLGADSMVLGVAIGRDDMDILRSALKRVEIDPEARRQMEKALKGYKSNGEGWDFDGHYLGLSKIFSFSHRLTLLTFAQSRGPLQCRSQRPCRGNEGHGQELAGIPRAAQCLQERSDGASREGERVRISGRNGQPRNMVRTHEQK